MFGLTANKATQPSLAGAWAELGKNKLSRVGGGGGGWVGGWIKWE